jgi:hypothetical protein
VDLLRAEIFSDTSQAANNLVNKWFGLASLMANEMSSALVGYFDKCITSHVLDT